MKRFIPVLAIALATLAFVLPSKHSKLDIGDKAPKTSEKLKDISGADMSLEEMKKDNGLLVIFSCNTCPFVIGNGSKSEGWEGRYNDIQALAAEKGIGMVLVNPNEAKRDAGDNFEDMVAHAKEMEYTSNYVIDNEHRLADAFGAMKTPHVFLFDKSMALAYQGAIDDNVNRSRDVKENYLIDAIEAMAAGKGIQVTETVPMGCSIKRVAN